MISPNSIIPGGSNPSCPSTACSTPPRTTSWFYHATPYTEPHADLHAELNAELNADLHTTVYTEFHAPVYTELNDATHSTYTAHPHTSYFPTATPTSPVRKHFLSTAVYHN